jgi:hypothetical protein
VNPPPQTVPRELVTMMEIQNQVLKLIRKSNCGKNTKDYFMKKTDIATKKCQRAFRRILPKETWYYGSKNADLQ